MAALISFFAPLPVTVEGMLDLVPSFVTHAPQIMRFGIEHAYVGVSYAECVGFGA